MPSNVISKFQMKSFKTHRFDFSVIPMESSYTDQPVKHEFLGKYAVSYTENKWRGLIMVYYSSKSDHSGDSVKVDIVMDGFCEYDAPNTPDDREQFKKLLTMNGAVALLSILRGQVAAATTALGLSPAILVPSVNLNHFKWEEQELSSSDEQ